MQEHIYEFIITEKHHCQLLKVIQRVFCEGLTQYLDMKPELLERLFPQLDSLIDMHFEFLRQLRERQDQTAVIPTIADILLNQFQEEHAVRWRSAYGAFCSNHLDAVSIYKEQIKSDRRFQEFVQQCANNPLLRKMGIPECILTVTTRITKYPLLIEPLIKTAKVLPSLSSLSSLVHRHRHRHHCYCELISYHHPHHYAPHPMFLTPFFLSRTDRPSSRSCGAASAWSRASWWT